MAPPKINLQEEKTKGHHDYTGTQSAANAHISRQTEKG